MSSTITRYEVPREVLEEAERKNNDHEQEFPRMVIPFSFRCRLDHLLNFTTGVPKRND